jgi:hypothetical protein
MQQASLDRLSNDRQLQKRFASHETLPPIPAARAAPLSLREPLVTDQPALADFFAAGKRDRSQGILLRAREASYRIDCSAMIR